MSIKGVNSSRWNNLNVYKAVKYIKQKLTILLKDNIKITEGCQELRSLRFYPVCKLTS